MTHVLIVDDLEESRYLLQTLLEGNGNRVTAACDGHEALTAARREPPDVIISDALMPNMDGFALCQAWMQDPALRTIPFIFYSATYTTPDDEKLALALGAERYLIKPQEPDVLLRELRSVVEGRLLTPRTPASPLDNASIKTLYETVISRKLEDKVRQLEKANRALQESEARYKGICDCLQDVVVETTLDGTVLDVTQQIETASGGQYKREDVIGQSSSIFYQDPVQREALLKTLKKNGRAIDFESTFVNRDGTVIPCSISATFRLGADNKPRSIVSTMRDITERKKAQAQIQHYVMQIETALMSTVKVAMTLSEMRDPYTAGHERRVAEIAVGIGAELGFDARRLEGLRVAGYLHDVGKITVPTEILAKPGKLSAPEFSLIKGHPEAGFEILKHVEFPWPVAEVALQHHERWDGSGYPRGLKGEAVLLEARIMAVADVTEAMASHRPYRPGLGIEKALAEIERGRGTAYDAVVADACLRLFREKGFTIPA